MTAAEALAFATANGVQVSLEEPDKLSIAGEPSDEILAMLKDREAEIVAFLRGERAEDSTASETGQPEKPNSSETPKKPTPRKRTPV